MMHHIGGGQVPHPLRAVIAGVAIIAATVIGPVGSPAYGDGACTLIVPSRLSGWAADLCPDPSVPSTMRVTVDGRSVGAGAVMRVYQDTDDHTRQPAVMALYGSSYVRLKQGNDPVPPTPFGASVILSDAYWSGGIYHGNATLTSLDVYTSAFPTYFVARATGRNGDLVSKFDLVLGAPTDLRSELVVTRQTTAAAVIAVDPGRAAAGEGSKIIAGASTMWINDSGPCAGGYQHCHDADAARLVDGNGALRDVRFSNLTVPGFMFPAPVAVGSRWIDVRHTDSTSWQGGDPPSIRICTDALPPSRSYRAQGYVAASDDVNLDNVGGPWVQDDWRAGVGWHAGESETVRFRVVARDDFASTSTSPC